MSAPHIPDLPDPWLRRFRPRPEAKVRLVCFPHAGGSATYYHALAQSPALMPTAEVLAVQYPGRQDRRKEQLMDSVPELADRITASLTPYDDRPLALFGHSMGAVLAFEVAQRLRERSENQPHWLFVSGRRAPSRFRRGTVHLLGDAELVDELRRVGGTDPRFLDDEELLAEIIPVVRNDYRATEEYRWSPSSPLRCPVTALAGDRDTQAPPDDVAAWRQHTDGPFDLKVFSGGHFYLDAHRQGVTDVVSEALARIAGRREPVRGTAQ
ncbi:thioesterase II family protein [Streptomyces aurantiacus]|uniref:thioesterase II family protein n=1 Tax=Streptomyces aurantiacus TaxID=47760 RepID=UPI0006E26652|nr:alpha/beta fold hydrolase [Streptomyces aurantiacus]